MAEDAVFRKATLERVLERVDVINALADKRALAEHVLINIGDCARIRVYSGRTTEQPRIP